MKRQRIPKYVLSIWLSLLVLGMDALDDNIAIESNPKEVMVDRRSDGFGWSFITEGSKIEAEPRMEKLEWSYDAGTHVEEDADKRLDDLHWDSSTESSYEDDVVEERMDDIDWSFLTEETTIVEEEAEHRIDDFNWNWNIKSSEEDDSEDRIGESIEERDAHNHEYRPTKWHGKLKRIKHHYGPPKAAKRPKPQYGPPKSQYGVPKRPLKFRKHPKSKYGAPKAHNQIPKGYYGPSESNYEAPPYSAPVSYSSQLTHSIPATHRQPESVSNSAQPAAVNYPTTVESSPSINIPPSSPIQSPPIAGYTTAPPVQNYHPTSSDPVSYESPTHPPSGNDFGDAYLQSTESPDQKQSLHQPVEDKSDNLGFFEYVNFPNFEEIFKQIFKF
ncbi:uncharacterized protein LOC130696773 [Daphnia carinata]|uniref:uncharacterized protein LOC130696773 n=1 Tax=Daphnia carinata TaxID=120202 RepID=UPI00257DD6FD|nr:uncharacterized protein LOC130696773 [Daphnia carinata]